METASQTSADGLEPHLAGWLITAPDRQYLLQTAKWAKLLAITGFILVAYWVVNAFTYNTFLESFFSQILMRCTFSGIHRLLYHCPDPPHFGSFI